MRTVAITTCLFIVFGMASLANGQSFSVVHAFKGTPDGALPYASLLEDAGNFYGTTNQGGSGCTGGCGTVFRLSSGRKETVLYRFTGGQDQEFPWAGVIRDAAGNLFGSTFGYIAGGNNSNFGTVFRLNRSGKLTVLHTFNGPPSDGANPEGTLVEDGAGNLFGTTAFGGSATVCGYPPPGEGCGTVFKIDSTGKETVLYDFSGGTDGGNPQSALISDGRGNLYGTTAVGGDLSCNGPYGCGTVFKINKNGKETVLHAFHARPDGREPIGQLIRDSKGNLYGTTYIGGGGCGAGCGTVFKLSPSGKETTLYGFKGGNDGQFPTAGLVRDKAGNLYGTVTAGGSTMCPAGCGLVFKISTTGKESIVHVFKNRDGDNPIAGLTFDAVGNLYGTTLQGGPGSCDCGLVFKIKP